MPFLAQVKVADYGLTTSMGLEGNYYQHNVNASLKLAVAW